MPRPFAESSSIEFPGREIAHLGETEPETVKLCLTIRDDKSVSSHEQTSFVTRVNDRFPDPDG